MFGGFFYKIQVDSDFISVWQLDRESEFWEFGKGFIYNLFYLLCIQKLLFEHGLVEELGLQPDIEETEFADCNGGR